MAGKEQADETKTKVIRDLIEDKLAWAKDQRFFGCIIFQFRDGGLQLIRTEQTETISDLIQKSRGAGNTPAGGKGDANANQ